MFEGQDDIDGGDVRVQIAFAEIHVDIKALLLEIAELSERGDLLEKGMKHGMLGEQG
jgi:hypothetical protein